MSASLVFKSLFPSRPLPLPASLPVRAALFENYARTVNSHCLHNIVAVTKNIHRQNIKPFDHPPVYRR